MSNAAIPLILIVLLFLFVYFGPIRKQQRAARSAAHLQSQLGVGDEVMTTSGLYATVVAVDDDILRLEIAPGVTVAWARAAIRPPRPGERAPGAGRTGVGAGTPERKIAEPVVSPADSERSARG